MLKQPVIYTRVSSQHQLTHAQQEAACRQLLLKNGLCVGDPLVIREMGDEDDLIGSATFRLRLIVARRETDLVVVNDLRCLNPNIVKLCRFLTDCSLWNVGVLSHDGLSHTVPNWIVDAALEEMGHRRRITAARESTASR